MAYYVIHACNKRIWYVQEFLIPSMIEQGILKENIIIYRDKNRIGNLRAWVDSCNKVSNYCEQHNINGMWHLQDDVVLSKNFAKLTEQYDYGLQCGFTCNYEDTPIAGSYYLYREKMWFSFPCIRIPQNMLQEFAQWANLNLWQSEYFKPVIYKNKADDLVFREWLYDNYRDTICNNIAPNLVNHIDDLIDGSVTNPTRNRDTRSMFWDEDDVIEQLKIALDKHKNI